MAHEIEGMVYVGETPWHGLGVQLDEPPTTEEAIRMAGLDWTVRTQRVFTELDGQMAEAPAQATVRESDGSVLGVVGPGYAPLQNAKAFEFFDPFVQAGEVSLETAGSLREGRRIWVLGKVNRDPVEVVPGDAIRNYVLLANGHDGSLAVRVGFTPIRVVCNNTLQASLGGGSLLKIRHTKNVAEAVERVRETIDVVDQKFRSTAEQLSELSRVGVDEPTLRRYVERVFKVGKAVKDDELAPDEVEADNGSGKRIVSNVVNLFENGRGANMPGVRGTLWGAYNAVTEYVSHERGADRERRLDQQWFGAGAAISRRALDVAVEMARAA